MGAEQIKACLHELQVYFAGRRPGWRERATADQIQAHEDREREHDNLLASLLRMEGDE